VPIERHLSRRARHQAIKRARRCQDWVRSAAHVKFYGSEHSKLESFRNILS